MMKLNIQKSYKHYKNKSSNEIDLSTYLKINNGFNKFLMKRVLDGEVVTLPSRMGTLCVIGKKQKFRRDVNGKIVGLAPDCVKTKKLWDSNPDAKKKKQLLYHLNNHTNGIRYKYVWSKSQVIAKNKVLYSLHLTRNNKRTLHKKIMEGASYKTL